MKTAIVGTGYVGLVTGTCFAEMGANVICVDVDQTKIDKLKNGIIPIYEPGLEELVKKNYNDGRLNFTTDLASCINDVDIVFSAVGTPPDEDGSADLSYVLEVARTIGRTMNKYLLVVTKSTVPVGTAALVRKTIQDELDARNLNIGFDVASNPEFLKEGNAVNDFMHPDRVVVGVESEKAKALLSRLYKPFLINNFRIIFMDVPSAEMTKYAANAMLATRISFMNNIANLCEKVGADINMVRLGIGSDVRIGSKFLHAVAGMVDHVSKRCPRFDKTASENNVDLEILRAVERVNDGQKTVLFKKLAAYYPDKLAGKTVAVWGLSFKPETDDMRDAPSLLLINALIKAGCVVKAYDPIAIPKPNAVWEKIMLFLLMICMML